MNKTFEQICKEIDNGTMTIDEINTTDWSHIENPDFEFIESKISYFNTYQMALKIAMNSLYGAIANVHFPLFNRDIAASITGNGRIFIQGLASFVNKKLQKALCSDANFVVYGDTDSVVGDTEIITDKFGTIKIKNYFDNINGEIEERDPTNLIKHIRQNDKTYSITKEGKLRKNQIMYVMKHKVYKRMFKITVGGKSVTVTEDHSIIAKRNGKIIEIKPNEVKKGDFLIELVKDKKLETINFTDDFVIEDLGLQEEWVYDIEVENDHNFFGNGICVHNSVYFTLDNLVEKIKSKSKLSDDEIDKILDKVLNFDRKHLDKWVQEYIDKFSDDFNAFNKDPIGAKLEKIADKGMFIAKKKYALRAIWDEGSFLVKNPKMAVTGLEIVRSSTPMFCRRELKKVIDIILDNDSKDVINFIKEAEKAWYKADINDIARVSGIGTMSYAGEPGFLKKVDENGNLVLNKNGKPLSAPINVRAAMNHNIFIEENKMINYQPLTADDKIKYVFLTLPNTLGDDVIGFLDEEFLRDSGLLKFVDKARMWEGFFMSPLNIMLDAVGYDINENFELDEWI